MPAEAPAKRIVVVGGGISGLTAAYTLARARANGAPIDEYLLEARDRLGGVIQTENADGFVIEAGPDSFLAEKPEAAALARELGLGGELMGSNDRERRTYILHRGRLVPLPDGLMLLVPTRIWPMVTTPLLPLASKLAMAAEWFTRPPADHERRDESVASFVRRHFGEAMLENIADPLLAGVYGGDSGALSIACVLSRFYEMERKYGSLTRATLKAMRERRRRQRSNPGPANSLPLFMTLKNGLSQLAGALVGRLDKSRIGVGQRVVSMEYAPGGPGGADDSCSRRYLIACEGDRTLDADAVILAMPAHVCGNLLGSIQPALASQLSAIPYSSSMTVSLAYSEGALEELPPGFGFLVPRRENRRMLACTFVHGKFKHRTPEGKALLRCFLGGTRDPQALGLSDGEIVSLVRNELKEILNFGRDPLFSRVHRWPSSMAQYTVGHGERLREIEEKIRRIPGVFLAGNAYTGIGISDCVRTGRNAAELALRHLGFASQPRAS